MAIDVIPDPTTIVVEGSSEVVVSNIDSTISVLPIVQTVPDSSTSELVLTEGPVQTITDANGINIIIQTVSDIEEKGQYSIEHGKLSNLLEDDHPQYLNTVRAGALYAPLSHVTATGNVHSLIATDIPGLGPWATLETQTDEEFILAYMGVDSIPSTRIASIAVGKISAGLMTAKISLAESFTASSSGAILNDDMQGILLGEDRITMGFVVDTNNTYVLRHYNGYTDDSPNYQSNFSVDVSGNVRIAGEIIIAPGSAGILNLTDAGNLATRDATTYYNSTQPIGAILGDLWYDLDNGNTPYRWNGVGWDSIKDADIAIAQGTADGKIQTFYQDNEPTGMTAVNNGDIWFDTDDGNKMYIYDHSGSGWYSAQDSSIGTAIAAAATAQSTADGKITTYTGLEPSVVEGLGDLWFETATQLLHRAVALGPPIVWEVVSNSFDDTNLLTDTANLGGTALWAGVTGDGTPSDYADVTNVGSSNYVIRGLSSPNSISGNVTQGIAGLGDWSVILGDATVATTLIQFDLPPLAPDIDFVVSFWASSALVGTTFWTDLTPTSLPQFEVTSLGSTATKYSFVFNSADVAMVNASLRFYKLTTDTNPADPVTIYDVKFERGTQSTDWSPFIPTDDAAENATEALERAVSITTGGITLGGTSKIHTINKDTFADTTAGIYLGWDATEADYVLNIGSLTNKLTWNGTTLDILGHFSTTLAGGLKLEIGTTVGTVPGGHGDDSNETYLMRMWDGSNGASSRFYITAGGEFDVSGVLEISENGTNKGYIHSVSRTSFTSGNGFWMGYDTDGNVKAAIGDSAGSQFTWDASTLAVQGNMTVDNIVDTTYGLSGMFVKQLKIPTGSIAGSHVILTGTAGLLSVNVNYTRAGYAEFYVYNPIGNWFITHANGAYNIYMTGTGFGYTPDYVYVTAMFNSNEANGWNSTA